MAQSVKLLANQINQLKSIPEDGIGYHIIDIEMIDGQIHKNMLILNSEYLRLKDNKYVDPYNIWKFSSVNKNGTITM
jgi:hypothetical protein